jgi:hypothetical protein
LPVIVKIGKVEIFLEQIEVAFLKFKFSQILLGDWRESLLEA